jgi:tetratricopeptide (TPR) repeat protein
MISNKMKLALYFCTLIWPISIYVVPAAAQQAEADVLLTQAALAYDDQQYDKAIGLLDRVLVLEPNNARANYYKGLVFLSQQKLELATKSLESALAGQPRDLFIRYHLGQAYFLQKSYDKAEPLLSSVYAEQPKLEHVGFYMGFLQYQRKSYSEALAAFSQVETMDPDMRQLIGFYKGLTLGVLGLPEQAVSELDDALKVQTSEPFSAPVQRMRDTLTAVKSTERRFRASLGFGGYYSDNVALNPNRSNDPFAESLRTRSTTSPGLLMTAHGEYSWLRRGPLESIVSYNFFQTVNLNDGLSRFNIQNHQGALAGYYRGTVRAMPYQVGLTYAYDYLFLGQDGFLSRHTPTLSGTLLESAGHMTTGLFRFQDKTFFREPDPSGRFSALQRDAMNWMGGLTHTFRFQEDRHFLSIGYQYDVEDATGSDFSYAGHRLLVGGVVSLPWQPTPWGATRLRYDYQVHWRGYRSLNVTFPQFAPNTIRRDDTEQLHFVRLEQPLPYNFVVSFQYQRIQNDSNLAVYDYTQNIFYLVTTWTY